MGKIKLICDSMADLTKEQIEKYTGVESQYIKGIKKR